MPKAWVLVLMTLLAACSQPQVEKLQGYTQGTSYHISYWQEAPVDAVHLHQQVEARFAEIDRTLSNYREDSDIEQFNRSAGGKAHAVPASLVQLVRQAQQTYQQSEGCYDLTIRPLFKLWGFFDDQLQVPDETTLNQVLQQVGMDKLTVIDDTVLQKNHTDVHLDVSSIAQGYSVAAIAQLMETLGIDNYLVEIGGELVTHGRKPDGQPWRIAIERPLPDEQKLHKILAMPSDRALAVMTSGTYRHFFAHDGAQYSHILDARTGKPVTHETVLTTVIDPDPVRADAWSTALLCLGAERGLAIANQLGLAALFIELRAGQLVETQSQALQAQQLFVH
ncbi:MAG: FAD:protein FMN transferase [Methylococcales bacterium]|nr:FAD:protein FMN transferase [Methylococcales bacterium]